jgi:glycosyltransferase involved in cell wall biosynthesis
MLSIIIPTHNEENYLPKLLESLKRQSFSDYEVVVSDANSTDRTREIARDFGAKVVEGGMPAAGRNRGAEAATGDLFLFLDADVILSPSGRSPVGGEKYDFLERVIDEFKQKKFSIATCQLIPGSRRFIDKFFHAVYDFYVSKMARIMPHAPGFFILIKRDLFLAISGFDESITLCEDTDLTIRASKIGKFGFLKSEKIKVSVRRFDTDGRWNVALKYLLAEMILLFGKRIRGWPKYNLFYKK